MTVEPTEAGSAPARARSSREPCSRRGHCLRQLRGADRHPQRLQPRVRRRRLPERSPRAAARSARSGSRRPWYSGPFPGVRFADHGARLFSFILDHLIILGISLVILASS